MRYDLIYLDIEMKKQNGVDAARELRIIDNKVLIIYVTGHEGFAKEVFEVSAFRFITKPIDIDLFEKYFKDAITQVSRAPQYFQYQYNKISYRLSIDEIMYFQSDRRITYIITKSGSEKCYGKLNNIEKSLIDKNIFFYRTTLYCVSRGHDKFVSHNMNFKVLVFILCRFTSICLLHKYMSFF